MGFTLTKSDFNLEDRYDGGRRTGSRRSNQVILAGALFCLVSFYSSVFYIFGWYYILCSTTVGSIRRISCFPSIWE